MSFPFLSFSFVLFSLTSWLCWVVWQLPQLGIPLASRKLNTSSTHTLCFLGLSFHILLKNHCLWKMKPPLPHSTCGTSWNVILHKLTFSLTGSSAMPSFQAEAPASVYTDCIQIFVNLTTVEAWYRRMAFFLSPAASSGETNLESLLPFAWETEKTFLKWKGRTKQKCRDKQKRWRERNSWVPHFPQALFSAFPEVWLSNSSFNSRTHLSVLLHLPYIYFLLKLAPMGFWY